jgi:hypothetical protein
MAHQLEVDMHPYDTTRQCVFCGESFTLTKKHPNNVYCSRKCVMRKNAIAQRLPPFTCAWCGQLATSLKSKAKYCSQQCAGKASNAARIRPSVTDRFWKKVQKTDSCWVWIGGLSHSYGWMGINSRHVLAHRISWELHNGPIPDGLYVCHHCDNPPCVRPDHLFLGTHDDNMNDKISKGRQGHGKKKP